MNTPVNAPGGHREGEPTTLESEQSPAEIAAELDRTRNEVDQTLDELQDRLSPRRMLNRASSSLRETSTAATTRARAAFDRAPLPITVVLAMAAGALIGYGVLAGRRRR